MAAKALTMLTRCCPTHHSTGPAQKAAQGATRLLWLASLFLVSLLLTLIFSTIAYADIPEEFSVAVTCDKKNKVFSLDPVISSYDAGTLLFEGNGSELDQNKSELECRISNNHIIKLKYEAIPPKSQGMCMMTGFTQILGITHNSTSVYGAEIINSGCFFEKEGTLISLKIYLKGSSIKLQTCKAHSWQYPNYVGRSCSTKIIALTHHSSGTR